jgi:parvulin-like peptidyl-prolyl isomerase
MLRSSNRSLVEELALAIREGELDFASAAIRYSQGPESAQGGRIGPISPHVGHPELNSRLEQANEGALIGPFPIGDMHVLLRLDNRITTRLDDSLQDQLIEELYAEWLQRQISALLAGESIEPMEYLPQP